MTLTFDDYKKEKLGEFEHRIEILRKRYSIFFIVSFIIIAILLYLLYSIKFNQEYRIYFVITAVVYILASLAVILKYIEPKRPILKEYLLYYIWRGFDSLTNFVKGNRDKEYLKKSRRFFIKIQSLIFSLVIVEPQFEIDIKRNKMKKDFDLLIDKYILPKLKVNIKSKEYTELWKISANIFNLFHDEKFEEVSKFLSGYLSTFQKTSSLTYKFKEKIRSSSKILLIFKIMLIAIVFGILAGVIFYFGYGWIEVAIVITILSGLYMIYKIVSLALDKILSK